MNDYINRHSITVDAVSILEKDAIDDSLEENVNGNLLLSNMIRYLEDPRDKFIILALQYGFQKQEIGHMLNVHPATISRMHQSVQRKLAHFRTEMNPDQAIIVFFETIYGKNSKSPAITKPK